MSDATVRERPILFSGRLVRAILDGRKTQTRRVVRESLASDGIEDVIRAARPRQRDEYRFMWAEPDHEISLRPYAMPGDRLWVRETWLPRGAGTAAIYRADHSAVDAAGLVGMYSDHGWRPSIFMPRWASRIDLEVVAVRVERLQEISEEDAIAEGVQIRLRPVSATRGVPLVDISSEPGPEDVSTKPLRDWNENDLRRHEFAIGWDQINGKRAGASWAANPFVWAISFRRIR